jgi:hypothetical protein
LWWPFGNLLRIIDNIKGIRASVGGFFNGYYEKAIIQFIEPKRACETSEKWS